MNTCETCKFWGVGEFAYEAHFSNVTAKMCGKIKMRNETNNDNGDYSDNEYDPDLPIQYEYEVNESGRITELKDVMHHKAYCQDGSSYRAELVTRPDFGCVLHEDS